MSHKEGPNCKEDIYGNCYICGRSMLTIPIDPSIPGVEWEITKILEEAYSRNDLGEVWAVAELCSLLSSTLERYKSSLVGEIKEAMSLVECELPGEGESSRCRYYHLSKEDFHRLFNSHPTPEEAIKITR